MRLDVLELISAVVDDGGQEDVQSRIRLTLAAYKNDRFSPPPEAPHRDTLVIYLSPDLASKIECALAKARTEIRV